ncbi:MAG TPA: FixH family protein [Geminicoccaceae bacterium]|nr:FixH family protein [Geminicoccaceae bacterium]
MTARRGASRRQAAIVVLLAALLTGMLPTAARAHAVLLETSPAADAVVARAPAAVLLRFNEPVRPIVVQLLRAEDEAALSLPPVEATDTRLRLPLPQGLPDGSYVLSYRVTSADGHPVAGSFVFSVGAGPGQAIASPVDRFDVAWKWLGVAARALWYGSLLLAAGRALFLALIRAPQAIAPRLNRGLIRLAIAGIASGPLLLAAEGGGLLGGPPGSLLSLELWRLALGSSVFWTVATGAAGLAILARARDRRFPLLAGALVVALSFGLSGHAATAGPRWLTAPVIALHVLSAAFWVGALWPLLLALGGAEAKTRLQAFSTLAVGAIACLILAGTVLAALQLGSVTALVTTDYGRRLLIKLILVMGLLGLAALNRLVLTPAIGRSGRAERGLRLTIATELALATGVIVLTASLGAVPPPRALAAQAAARQQVADGQRDYAVYATLRGYKLVLVATPATAGVNRIDLYFTGPDGRPAAAKAVELSATLPAHDVEALRLAASPVEPGHFRAPARLPLAGEWQIRAGLVIDDFTRLDFRTRIVIVG